MTAVLKKLPQLQQVNENFLQAATSTQMNVSGVSCRISRNGSNVGFCPVQATTEMVMACALTMRRAKSSAYVLAPHEDVAFLELKTLLQPFGITRFFTDGWGAYQRHLDEQVYIIGKSNTQKIERKHLTSENKD